MTTLATASNNNSPDLIQRMIGDMRIRHLSPDTIRCYSRHVKKFAEFLNRSLDQATAEDIRSFQLHLIQIRKLSWSSFNLTGMMHLFQKSLQGRELIDLDCRLAGDSVNFSRP